MNNENSSTGFREQIAEIAAGVTITSATSFVVAGITYHSSEAAPLLLERLIDALYTTSYLAPATSHIGPHDETIHHDAAFSARLAEHNRGEDRWDGGWTVYAISDNGTLSVAKGDCCRTAVAGEFRAQANATASTSQVEIFLPHEQSVAGAPYYVVFGTTPADAFEDTDRFRVYFNITAAGAPRLMELLTDRMNTFRIPFRLKFLASPSTYGRPDACVLYVAMRYTPITLMIVDQISRELSPELGPETPACTFRLAPGVAAAEDTVTGESFGRHRCGLIALGLVDAWLSGDQSLEKKIMAIEHRFAQAELSIDRPYLSRTNRDLFEQFLFPETNND